MATPAAPAPPRVSRNVSLPAGRQPPAVGMLARRTLSESDLEPGTPTAPSGSSSSSSLSSRSNESNTVAADQQVACCRLRSIQSKLEVRAGSGPEWEELRRLDLTTRSLRLEGDLALRNDSSKRVNVLALMLSDCLVLLQREGERFVLRPISQPSQQGPLSPLIKWDKVLFRPNAAVRNTFFLMNINGVQMHELSANTAAEYATWVKHIQQAPLAKLTELKPLIAHHHSRSNDDSGNTSLCSLLPARLHTALAWVKHIQQAPLAKLTELKPLIAHHHSRSNDDSGINVSRNPSDASEKSSSTAPDEDRDTERDTEHVERDSERDSERDTERDVEHAEHVPPEPEHVEHAGERDRSSTERLDHDRDEKRDGDMTRDGDSDDSNRQRRATVGRISTHCGELLPALAPRDALTVRNPPAHTLVHTARRALTQPGTPPLPCPALCNIQPGSHTCTQRAGHSHTKVHLPSPALPSVTYSPAHIRAHSTPGTHTPRYTSPALPCPL
ncbi:Rho guanine nucleotide exchange factor 12 [Papilio machaon]|uniref:Rho guanine nucleotide exchange factor 12 n=1 Tax=Papilio machaon TaxID=76193 RepID=A0A0N1PIC2_PAPMA|nr:Rho guanine nucleotide exchange factor 12 [Papilio machaon]